MQPLETHEKCVNESTMDSLVNVSDLKSSMIQSEESIANYSHLSKRLEMNSKILLWNEHGMVDCHVESSQNVTKDSSEKRDLAYRIMARADDLGSEALPETAAHSTFRSSSFECCHVPNPNDICDNLPKPARGWNTNYDDPRGKHVSKEKKSGSPSITEVDKNDRIQDPQITMKNCINKSPQNAKTDNDRKEILDASFSKGGKYFYYEKPLYEETGMWMPVSVPPMSESEHEEWTKGICSNGGFIPEGDLGWSQYIGADKEMTMWDVVLEMILVARGKVAALASGDVTQISWISSHLIEQAWKEMAQTLTEANFCDTREILESEPPKWLPDSSASSCMLCSVRFHPFMCTRHHCRFCGGIFCSECTKGRSLLPEKFRTGDPQRVCDVCCVRLEFVQSYLMDQVSHAAQLPIHDLTDLSTLRSWVNFPWGQSMEYEIYKATNTILGYNKICFLREEKRIPECILRNASGLAILTVVKVGMMIAYNVGTGLVIARREDGSWSPPSAISSFGVGWGAQAGGELIDFIVVLRTSDAVKTFCSDAHISIGAGLSAAIGIIGRTAEADVRAGPSGYASCYTYSCSKGAFIGFSLEGSVVTTRARENSRFYGSQSINASEILLGSLPRPPAAANLYGALGDL